MTWELLGRDPESGDGNSPAVRRDPATGDHILQRRRLSDAEAVAIGEIPPRETAIRFPARMTGFFPEVNGGGSEPR